MRSSCTRNFDSSQRQVGGKRCRQVRFRLRLIYYRPLPTINSGTLNFFLKTQLFKDPLKAENVCVLNQRYNERRAG